MRREFWLERWEKGQTGWHQAEVNSLLVKYWRRLDLPRDCPVFVPLCGKSLDMIWLRRRGHPVCGVEIAETAVRDFFDDNGISFEVDADPLRYSGGGYRIHCGDCLEIDAGQIGPCRGAYDRGALVALPPETRPLYAERVQRILADAGEILLITLEYDQARAPGPPFSVPEEEVHALYSDRCRVRRLGSHETDLVPPHFKAAGLAAFTEGVYRITRTT